MFETVTIAWIFTATAVVFSFIKWYLSRNDDYWKKRGVPHNPRASFYKMYKETMEKVRFSLSEKKSNVSDVS
ncbi:hypothetical protein NPIL_257741 [Nephila pilipes]|uniref:Uncharacterized protein n=1 Tax=Nephila pilipes TaxID=299642 RepID=A0A8X6UTU0_NEPPI|nr:hypothetical protein NPIL_257741 [Nephila pilipes]